MDFTVTNYTAIDVGSINLLNHRHQTPVDEDSEDDDDKRRKVKLDLQLEKEFDALDTDVLLQDSCNYSTHYSMQNNWERPGNHDFAENILTVGILPTPTMLNMEHKKLIEEEVSEDDDDIKRKIHLEKCLEAEFNYVNEDEILQNSSNIRVLSSYNEQSNFFPTKVPDNNQSESEESELVNTNDKYNFKYDKIQPESSLIGVTLHGATKLTSELRKHSDSDEDEDDVRRKVKLDQQLKKEFDVLDTNAFLLEIDDNSSQISVQSNSSNHEQGNYDMDCQVNKRRSNDHDFPENFLTSGALPTPTLLNLEHRNPTDEDSEDEDDVRRKIQLDKCLEEELEELNEDKYLNEMTDIYDHDPYYGKDETSNVYGRFECKNGTVGRGSHFIHVTDQRHMNNLITERSSSQEVASINLGLRKQIEKFDEVEYCLQQKTKFNLASDKEFGGVDTNGLLLVENDAMTRQGNRCKNNSTPLSSLNGPENYFQFSSGAENNYDSSEKLNFDSSEILNLSNCVNNGTQASNIVSCELRKYSSNVSAPVLDGAQSFSSSKYGHADVDTIEIDYGCADKYMVHNNNGHNSGLTHSNLYIETASLNHLKQLYEVRGKELDRSAEQMASLKLKLDNVIGEHDQLSASKKELELFLSEKDNRIKGLYKDLKEKNESLNKVLEVNANIKCKLEIAENKVSNLQLQVTKLKSSNHCKSSQNVQESFVHRLRAFHSEEVEDLNKKLESYRQRYSDAEGQVKFLEIKLLETRKLNDKQLEEKIIHIKELEAKLEAEKQIQLLVSNPRSSSNTDREKELLKEIECLQDKLSISEKELKYYAMMLKNELFKSLVPNEDSSDCLGLIRNLNFDESRTGTPDISFAIRRSSSPNKRKIICNESLKQISNEHNKEEEQLRVCNAFNVKNSDYKQASNSVLLKDNISLREQNVKLIENYSILKETSEKLLLSINEICNEVKNSPKNLESVPCALFIEESQKLTKYMENFSLLQQQTFEQRNLENMRLKEHFLTINDKSLKEIKENMQIEYEGIIKCLKAEMNRHSENLDEAEDKHSSLFRESDELKGELCNIKVYSTKIKSQLELCQNENKQLKKKIGDLEIQRDAISRIKETVSIANAKSTTDVNYVEKIQDLIYRLNVLENENKLLKVQIDENAHVEKDLQNLKDELNNLKAPLSNCKNATEVREFECPGGLNELQMELNNVAYQMQTYRSFSEKIIELNSQLKSYKQQLHEKDQQFKALTSLCADSNELLDERRKLYETKEKMEQLFKEIKLLEESKASLLVKHGDELKAVKNQLRKQETLEMEMRKQWEVKLSLHNRMTRKSEKELEGLKKEIKDSVMQLEQKNKKYENLKLKFFKLQKNKTSVDDRLYFYQSELKRCEGNESELLASVTSWATQIKNTLTREISLIIDELKSLQKNTFLKAADLSYTMSHLIWILEKLAKLQISDI